MAGFTDEELENLQECLENYILILEDDPNFDIDDSVLEKHEKAKQALNTINDLME